MKPTAILSEAWRNIATGTTRALTCATILTLIAAGTAIFCILSNQGGRFQHLI